MNEDTLLKIFSCLANRTRLRILRYMISRASQPHPHVGMIADFIDVDHSVASRYLNELAEAGLILKYPSSQFRLFQLSNTHLEELGMFLDSLKGATSTEPLP